MYNRVTYKPKAINVEYDILNFYPIRQNINYCTRQEKKFIDDSSMVLLYNEHLCDILISVNTYLSGNNITERIDSVLSYLYIGGAQYRIY